jgi:hypothetical protein
VGKDEFFDALSNREGAGVPPDTVGPRAVGDDSFGGELSPDEDFSPDEEPDMDAADAAAFQQFLEASDEDDMGEGGMPVETLQTEAVSPPRRPGEILSQHRNHSQVKRVLKDQLGVQSMEQLQLDFQAKCAAAQDAKETLEIEEQKLRAMRKQAASQPADAVRLGYQEKEVSRAWSRLTEAEQARDLIELAISQRSDHAAHLGRKVNRDAAGHAEIAHRRHADEEARAKRIIAQERRDKEADAEGKRIWEQEVQRREMAANEHQSHGRRRLKGTHTNLAEKTLQADEVRESRFQHDAQRVLQLKGSIDKINRQIHGQNEARRKKEQKVGDQREMEKRDMLNEGKNPYEEWRKVEIAADKEKQVQLLKLKQELRNEKLMDQMIKEDISYKKKIALEKEVSAQKEVFQKEVGNYAKEQRIAAYIRKVTIGNVDVLDPTGTAIRIDASKVTIQKTHAFGLGTVRPEEIDKVEQDIFAQKRKMAKWKPPRPTDDDLPPDLDVPSQAPDSPRSQDGGEKDGRLWVPNLSVLEQKYLAAARERQKANICSVQRCWGKEFKGDAFIAKPSIIAFYDFEVGKKYRQVVEVTNVSLTFNQFKLLPLADKYKDFFDIEFVPPGRMSAGVTRYITVWFTPKVYEDIDTVFPVLAKTGNINFPLQCKTKKTILTITPQDADANAVIDFGMILAGEEGEQVLTIKNSGALAAGYKLEAIEKDRDFVNMVSWTPERSEFRALGTSKITFTFKPTALGTFATMLTLTINNGAQGMARYVSEVRVLLRGSCIDVPIFVEQEEYDLKTCVYGHTFRENIVLHNRQSVAMKIHVDQPTSVAGELALNPTVAYIQGKKSQAIGVKFSPGEDFLKKNPKYRDKQRPNVNGAFRIPVRVTGADQVLPVNSALIGILTSNNVSFLPSKLAFGSVYLGAAATCTLTIANESALPQRYAFMRLPAYLTVEDYPNDVIEEEDADASGWGCGTAVLDGGGFGAFGMVLPGEKKRVCVTYCPESATEMDYTMTFKVITGSLCCRTFSIPCTGQGKQPPIVISHTQIDMSSIPCDATCKDSIELTNKSNIPYTINLLLPPSDITGLFVSPVCCTLSPKETKRLQVEFKPIDAYVKLLEKPAEEPTPEVDEEGNPVEPKLDEEGNPIPPEPKGPTPAEHRLQRLKDIRMNGGRRWEVADDDSNRSIHASWKMPIAIRVKAEDHHKQERMPVVKMYFGVRTCVLPSVLRVDPLNLDFGQVTALQRQVVAVTLQNLFPGEPQELNIEPLPENACFTVLNAPRTIGSKPFKLMVEFTPERVQIYQSVLKLYTQNTRVQVQLKGKGVRPVLKIKPEDGILQLGSVIYNKACSDYTEKTLEIENDSPFELCYKMETLISADPNHVGPPPFTLTPSTGVVPGNSSKTVKVVFRPHRPLAVFREKILVNVPNQREPTYVYLYGHCFSQQTFAMPDLDYGPFGLSAVKAKSAFVDSIAVGSGAAAGTDGHFSYKSAQQTEFSLVFELGEIVKCLLIGASVPAGTPNAPVNSPATTFDFQIQQSEFSSYFTVEAPGAAAGAMAKGPLKPGDPAIKASFRYKPPETNSLAVGDMELDLLGGIGKWITCKVKGILADGPATQEITVELKAYLQQI